MSRKTIITGALVAIVSLALLSTVAFAGRGGHGFGMAGGMDRAGCRAEARGMRPSFTTEQKDQMKEIRAGFDEERVELQNRMKVLHLEMQELVESGDPDFGKIERMIDDVTELRAETMKLRLRQHRAIRGILDDDQRVLFDRGIARMLSHGDLGARGGMMGCEPMNARGGRMGCGPMNARGGKMGCGPMNARGGMMGAGPMSADECIIMMKGEPGGEEVERRVIIKKIVDGDEIILEVEEEE